MTAIPSLEINLKDPRFEISSKYVYELPSIFDVNTNDTHSIMVRDAKFISIETSKNKSFLVFNVDQMKGLPIGTYTR